MKFKIWRSLIQILSYRKDLHETIKPFMENLKNRKINEHFHINDEQYFPFLKTFSHYNIECLYNDGIINEDTYAAIVPKKQSFEYLCNEDEKLIAEIIEADKLVDLQKLIREKDIHLINTIRKSFNEINMMIIPILQYCVMKKAMQCFKYLLINGIEDPIKTMKEDNYNRPLYINYEWDCLATAIYLGDFEIMKILVEFGIEKNKVIHIEAAVLSYRNSICREIIAEAKEKYETLINHLNMAIFASTINNNILIFEQLNGATITSNDIYKT